LEQSESVMPRCIRSGSAPGAWGGERWPDGTVCADYDNDQREIEAIRYALSKGQDHIDTAQFYGATHTEELVGEAIRGFDRSKLFIASKVWKSHAKRSATPRAVEGMLARLGIEKLDLLYVHAPWEGIPMQEYILGLDDAVAAYRPLERRLLADRHHEPLLVELAEKYSRTPAQIALAWLIGQEAVIPIPKASRSAHTDENLGALEVLLEPGDRLLLDNMDFGNG